MGRAAESTADPIWGVQERTLVYTGGDDYFWCCDCERWHADGAASSTYAHNDDGEWSGPSYDSLELFDECPDCFQEVWGLQRGYLFLSRDEAESWAEQNMHNLSRDGWRVFCYALPRDSSLTALLRVHDALDAGEATDVK